MTKQEYYLTHTNKEISENINKVHELLEYTANCYYLLAFTIHHLTDTDEPVYYIRQLLQFNRVWVILEPLEHVYRLDRDKLQDFIEDNTDDLKKKCIDEYKSFGFEVVDSVFYELDELSSRNEIRQIEIKKLKLKKKKEGLLIIRKKLANKVPKKGLFAHLKKLTRVNL